MAMALWMHMHMHNAVECNPPWLQLEHLGLVGSVTTQPRVTFPAHGLRAGFRDFFHAHFPIIRITAVEINEVDIANGSEMLRTHFVDKTTDVVLQFDVNDDHNWLLVLHD